MPTKFCISIIFSFSWDLKWPQEKTMLMENFGGTNKEHYGMLWFWSGQLHSHVWLDWISVFLFLFFFTRQCSLEAERRARTAFESGTIVTQSCIDNNTLFTYLLFLCFVFQFYSIFYSSSCRFFRQHAYEPQPQLAQDSGIRTFFDEELQCSHEDT